MALVGYVRASSTGSSLNVQREQLAGCDKLFEENSGAESSKQPHLKPCLDYLRKGDVLVVTRLDRLARSTHHLCWIARMLEDRKAGLRVLEQNIDTSDEKDLFLHYLLKIIGPFERVIRAELQKEGIQKARSQGIRFGQQKRLNAMQIDQLRQHYSEGTSIKTLMHDYSLSKSSVYRYLKKKNTNAFN